MITKETAKGIIDAISAYEACENAAAALRETKVSPELIVYSRNEDGECARHVVNIEAGIAINALLKQLAALGENRNGMNERARAEAISV